MRLKSRHIVRLVLIILMVFTVVWLSHLNITTENTTGLSGDTVTQPIDQLTQQKIVVNYLKKHQRLPNYYITKKQATGLGWNAREGNLCQVAPNKAIGGDHFGNREQRLPNKKGRRWFEADINYRCGRRGPDRVLFSNDGLIYITSNHYAVFSSVN